ncbi:hypothetical protein HY493_01400 [Candidatus Woesearchaeota archaeon]|nr:hypothetical protein [Candidatus Woesearchaeota archaeon]
MRRVFLDTNFILDTVIWKIDLFGELRRVCDFAYEIVVLDRVHAELEKYHAQGGKKKEVANVAHLVLASGGVKLLKTKGGPVDDLLVRLATKEDAVATQDQDLKRRLKAKGVPVVIIREKGYLQFVGR